MQHSNVTPGNGFTKAASDAEIKTNIQIVAELKRRCGGRSLTDAELDALIDPIDSKRTRCRLKGGKVRTEKLP